MTNEAIRPNIRDMISRLTGRPFSGSDKESGNLKEIPWEDKIAARLQAKAKKKNVSFVYNKEDKGNITFITFIWDDKELELTRHLEVGENGKTNFYMSAEKEQWDDADPWFRKDFDKIPVELHTLETIEGGKIVERVVYSAA